MVLALFDIDGTLTRSHVWGGLMAYFKEQRRKRLTHLAFTGIHYPLYFLTKRHLLNEDAFRRLWSSHLGWYLRGETEYSARQIGKWVAEEFLRGSWRPEVLQRLNAHRAQGDMVILVSAAPSPLVEAIAEFLHVHHSIGTRFEIKDGRYTGRAIPPPVIGREKLLRAKEYLREQSIQPDFAHAWAYADSITDLPLLQAVGHPVAVHPDERLRRFAQMQGWEVLDNSSRRVP